MSHLPHLKVPFQITGGKAETVEDGSIDEVRQNVAVLLSTLEGERLVVPDYGIEDMTFEPQSRIPDRVAIEAVVSRWEPRARIEFETADVVDGTAALTIRVGMAS